MPPLVVTLIGFLAQGLFSARMLVQWILSERARRVLSPTLFWVLSVIASILLCLYGWLRSDFAIILGQIFSYYIYLWNLRIKGAMVRVPVWVRVVLCVLPVLMAIPVAGDAPAVYNRFFANPSGYCFTALPDRLSSPCASSISGSIPCDWDAACSPPASGSSPS